MLRQLQQGFGKHLTVSSAQPSHHLSAQNKELSSSSVPSLTDADYEFLFSQLLEGVAHGWHPARIAKFFQQLGDRGQQQQWVAWLERFSTKILASPRTYEQQLGARMMRLGQLTESIPSVQQIGAVAHQIGRQLFYGNTFDLVWEYEGPDLEITAEAVSESFLEEEEDTFIQTDGAYKPRGRGAGDTSSGNMFQRRALANQIRPIEGRGEFDSPPRTPLENPVHLSKAGTAPYAITPNPIISQYSSTETASDSFVEEEQEDTSSQTEEIATNQLIIKFSSPQTAPESLSDEKEDTGVQQKIMTEGATSHFAHPEITTQSSFNKEKLSQNESAATHQLVVSDPSAPHSTFQTTDLPVIETKEEINLNNLDLVEGWFNLGLKQASSGDFQEAIESWERVLKLNPHICEAWHNRGSALGRIKKYQEAIESFDKALAINPKNYQAWNERAHALYQLQKWQEAIASWDKAIEIIPGDHQFWYKRGCALEKLQHTEESIASYEKALEIKPDFQQARSRYIKLLADNSQ